MVTCTAEEYNTLIEMHASHLSLDTKHSGAGVMQTVWTHNKSEDADSPFLRSRCVGRRDVLRNWTFERAAEVPAI